MERLGTNAVYALAKNVLRASEEEAILASRSCPQIEALMAKHHVPVESAIFSFLTEEQLTQSIAIAETKQPSSGWRRLLHL